VADASAGGIQAAPAGAPSANERTHAERFAAIAAPSFGRGIGSWPASGWAVSEELTKDGWVIRTQLLAELLYGESLPCIVPLTVANAEQ
jgi:hypothetical protein